MIYNNYSEVNKELDDNPIAIQLVGKDDTEEKIRKKYNVKSLKQLTNRDIPNEIKSIISKHSLPDGPGTSGQWLSGTNINQGLRYVMLHREIKGGCHGKTFFECNHGYQLELNKKPGYLAFKMRDFNQSMLLSNLDFDDYNCLGFVMNTDVSSGCGIHWVSVFIDYSYDQPTLEYFDSSGEKMMPEVIKFFKKVKKKIGKGELINVSTRVQQRDKHSCGPYAIYYIYSRIQGVPWGYFRDFEIQDHNMHKFRKQLFSLNG
jgi:hypothetical protein